MNDKSIKYTGYAIVFEEIPDEVTLSFNISNCPYHCKGCHSPELWNDTGVDLKDDFLSVLNTWKQYISCVCFMGDAGSDGAELAWMNDCVHSQGLKTAIYSGSDTMKDYFYLFDYVKIGHYDASCGGLNNRNTNQRMYAKHNGDVWDDITYRFWKG